MSRSSSIRRARAPRAVAASAHRSDWLPLGFALFLLLALAWALALAAGPAGAAPRARITIGSPDSSRVREIRIDDEGIRISPGAGGRIGRERTITINGEPIDVSKRSIVIGGPGDTVGALSIRGDTDNEIVEFFKDIHIQKGQQAGTVVAMLGNVRNDGVISGDCVSILGSIVQGDSAVIQGEAVSIGGSIHTDGRGSRIDGQTVSVGFLPFGGYAFPSVGLLLGFGLASLILFVLLSALVMRLFPERMVRIAETISRRTFLSLVLGLVSLPLAIMLGCLLFVTIIGIPLAVLLPFLYVLAAFVGFTAAAYLLGARILGRTPSTTGGMLGPLAAGTGLVTLFYAIGIPLIVSEGAGRVFGVGFLVLWLVVGTVCWMLGMGALLLSRIGQGTQPGPAVAPAPLGPPPAAGIPAAHAAPPTAVAPPASTAPPPPPAAPAV